MIEKQEMQIIEVDALVESVSRMHSEGYRLVQIGASKLTGFELTYSFDREYCFFSFKLLLPLAGAVVPSISTVYPNAFLYENEIQDLFGILFSGISIDYKGNFYRTSIKHPFAAVTKPLEPLPPQEIK